MPGPPLRSPGCPSPLALLAAMALLGALLPWPIAGHAQPSSLLDSVKQNPAKGQALCRRLRQLNGEGISFTSSRVTAMVSSQQGLTPADSEVLLTYVVGLYCPDVR